MKKNIKSSEPPLFIIIFCHCEERSDAAIPSFHFAIPVPLLSFSLSLCHSRESGNPSFVFLFVFSFSLSLRTFEESVAISSFLSVIARSVVTRQSHHSIISFIFFCHCEHRFRCAAISLFLSVIARSIATRQSHHSTLSFPRKRESILTMFFPLYSNIPPFSATKTIKKL